MGRTFEQKDEIKNDLSTDKPVLATAI